MDAEIKKAIEDFPEPKRTHVKMLREIILSSGKEISEAVKWNALTYSFDKNNLCFIYSTTKSDYVNLGFMQAVRLTDPKKLFEGTGKGMRHIKIRTPKDIPAAQIKKWMKESIALYKD
jgi:hypothetical protein